MRVGICDDDLMWCETAKKIIEDYGKQEDREMDISVFHTEEELINREKDQPDVLFMDIDLDGGDRSGIELVTELNQKWPECQIVYLTNYLYYATEVYQTEHIFFVLKEQFKERISDVFDKIYHERSQKKNRLIFTLIGGNDLILAPEELICFERNGRTTNIVTVHGDYMTWDKISVIMDKLPELDFVRCHNSYIVYFPAVREMLRDSFLMQDGRRVMISRSYQKKVKEIFMRWALTQIS